MRHCRLYDAGEFDESALEKIGTYAAKVEGKLPAINMFLFKFHEKTDALYKLVLPRLPVDLATEFRQTGGTTNGFDLFWKLAQKLDAARSDNALNLWIEIPGLGGVSVRKNFD